MLDTFLATMPPMLTMLLCILIGFALHKFRLAPENTATVLSRLEIYVLLPARVLSSFLQYCTVESILSQYRLVLYSVLGIALAVCLGIPLSRLFSRDRDQRNLYRYSLIIANMGFLGNAIVPQIMGQEALYQYVLFCLPINIVLYGWAITILIPEGKGQKQSLLQRFLNPTFGALILGLVLGLSGAGRVIPGFLTDTLESLSDCMGPVAMVLTGFVIGGYRIRGLLQNKKVYILSALRLVVLPLILVGALWLAGADKQTLLLAMFAHSTALGLNTVVIPAAYDSETQTGASMAMISHLGCIVTIPLLYALLNSIL